jgi:hypothetical protein
MRPAASCCCSSRTTLPPSRTSMRSRCTTSQARWIHHWSSASTQLGNLCSLTPDCLTSRCQSGGFGRGSSGSSNRRRRVRHQGRVGAKAEARMRHPIQSPLGGLVSVGGVRQPTGYRWSEAELSAVRKVKLVWAVLAFVGQAATALGLPVCGPFLRCRPLGLRTVRPVPECSLPAVR